MKKKGWISLWAIIFVLFCSFQALASQALEVRLEGVRADETALWLYTNNNSEGETVPEQYRVNLGGTELPVAGLQKFSETGEGTSWLFLVDVSGSIRPAKMDEMKAYLKMIAEGISAQDQVIVAALGDTLNATDFLLEKEAILQAIDRIQILGEDTNLYYGITEALKLLETEGGKNSRKALVVVSDGEDDQAAGITREEVNRQIEESHIPIFTTAVLGSGGSERSIEFAKVLGSFARLSPGGIHTALGVDEITAEESAGQVLASIAEGIVLQADLTGIRLSSGEPYLEVTLTVEGRGTAEDGYAVPASLLPKENGEPETTEAETEETPEETAVPETEAQPEAPGGAPMTWLLAGAIALLAICAGAIFALRKKKAGKGPAELQAGPTPPEQENNLPEAANALLKQVTGLPEQESLTEGAEEENAPQDGTKKEAEPAPKKEAGEEGQAGKTEGREIFMTQVGRSQGLTYQLNIEEKATIGRSPQKADYAFPDDPQMSGLHCMITVFGEDLVLCDMNSTNGTQVNGVPIAQPYILKCDDVIRIGSSEYRIHWND